MCASSRSCCLSARGANASATTRTTGTASRNICTSTRAVARDLGLLHAEIVAAMLDEHVELLERIVVEQEFDPLARGELALGVLRRDALLAAADAGTFAAGVEAGEDVLHGRLRALEARHGWACPGQPRGSRVSPG